MLYKDDVPLQKTNTADFLTKKQIVEPAVFDRVTVHTKGREQIVNKTFVKMMDELGYDVRLTYVKKEEK